MKLKQRILIAALIMLIVIITNSIILTNSVKAATIMDAKQADLHSLGNCGQLLKYKGVIVKTTYVEYTYNGNSYPAYCLNKTLPGVDEDLEYSVSANTKIDDIGLWRTIINGYPYKSLSELGVIDKEEAFTATKHAIYCYLFENTPEDYEAIGDGGERTLNALKQIVRDAEISTETQIPSTFTIEAENEEWLEDETNPKYVSKTYSTNSIIDIADYEVTIDGELPEESIITTIDGQETTKFAQGENFKIMLLKEKLDNDGKFTINIKTESKTKPVIYGESPDPNWQNYALTAYMYEDSTATYEDIYKKIEKPEKPEEPKKTIVPEPEKPIQELKILPITGM